MTATTSVSSNAPTWGLSNDHRYRHHGYIPGAGARPIPPDVQLDMTTKPPSTSAAPSKAPLLTQAGEAMFGTYWHGLLAQALGVNRRTIQRWEQGAFVPKPGMWLDLEKLVRERHAELANLLRELSKKNRA
jgi:hypothetical protein